MAKTARVIGDIIHDSLAIEAGAFLEGNIKRQEGAGRTSHVSNASSPAASRTSGRGAYAATHKPLEHRGTSLVYSRNTGAVRPRVPIDSADRYPRTGAQTGK